MQYNSVIRQRGQLTIPDSIRKKTGWLKTDAVVSVALKNDDEIVITPHTPHNQVKWDILGPALMAVRDTNAKTGQEIDLTKFIIDDREHRR